MLDHDYFVGSSKSPGSELAAAQERIKELEKEVSKLKAERFGLARFGYDNNLKMIQFYTGFQSARLLHDFIKLVKPTASLMKPWSQVQNKSTVVSNSTSPAVLFRQTSLCVENQVFLFLVRVKVGRFTTDLADMFNVSGSTVSRVVISWGNYLYFTLGRLPIQSSNCKTHARLD